jgi:hypothetical protein
MPRFVQQVLAIVLTGESGRQHEQESQANRSAIGRDFQDRLAIADEIPEQRSNVHDR